MNRRDDDIEFDFFADDPDDGPTQGGSGPSTGGTPGRGPRRPAGPPRGSGPLLRLALLVLGVIVTLFVVVWIVQEIAGSSRHSRYSSYMDAVNKIALQSTANGLAVVKALDTLGVKAPGLANTLHGIADQERQNVQAAKNLNPPGHLRDENQNLIEALELRVSGTDGLAKTFRTASTSATAAQLLAAQAERLLASDVVWDDLFAAPAKVEMLNLGITGVKVPSSHYVSDPSFVTTSSWGPVVQRINGAATGGKCSGIHGTNIVSVKATPSGPTLATGDTVNTVPASSSLAFQVSVLDSGDYQEVDIPVLLSIDTSPHPISQTMKINSINPGETVVVTFTGFSQLSLFDKQTTLTVTVKTVPCEVNQTNNTATYKVLFAVTGQ
jgi:hypothetical protein